MASDKTVSRDDAKRRRLDDTPSAAGKTGAVSAPKTIIGGSKKDASMLPPGWGECPITTEPIELFIPSKVPLDASWDGILSASLRYSPEHAYKMHEAAGRQVGMVVDLTNSSKYYHESQWESLGVRYLKIRCPGRGQSPTPEAVNEFCDEVESWVATMRANGGLKYVLVHCTHGHNRTGFMIVHFLMRMHNQTCRVADFVTAFRRIRPPGIYKSEYLRDLFVAYHEHRPSALRTPELPIWKPADDKDEDDGIEPNTVSWSSYVGSTAPPGSTMEHDDLIGEEISLKQEYKLQSLVAFYLCPGSQAEKLTFPGSQPVSLDSTNISLLNQRLYHVTWKADGTRYLLLLMVDGAYLIGRDNKIRRVWMRFPCRRSGNAPRGEILRQQYTLMDGEMVIDKDPKTGQLERRFLVFDIMVHCGEVWVDIPFSQRFPRIDECVINPRRHEVASRQPQWYDWSGEPFKIRRKDFWELRAADKIFKSLIPKLTHEADGLIFQGWNDPYVPRTCPELLKWKYGSMNSVDFKLKCDASTGGKSLLYVSSGSHLKVVTGESFRVPKEVDNTPTMLSGRIVECSWDQPTNSWLYMRVRTDKDTPNSFDVYKSVKQSIDDNITEDMLLDSIVECLEFTIYQEEIKKNDGEKVSQKQAK